ncbi:MAG: LON peptidase substrate-binding domain-containing protein, partial [Candidatus Pseudoruminococcus sp.]|nr:LON peptidase substrate-binding domain-containing protein [Candidatus Pseudoruminococcus sp.]
MDTEIIILPVIPTRGLVVYPLSTTQYDVSSKKAVIALTESIKKDQRVFMPATINVLEDDELESNLTKIGTVAEIKQAIRISDSEIRIIVEGLFRANTVRYTETESFMEVEVQEAELTNTDDNITISALKQAVKIAFVKNVQILPQYLRLSNDTVTMIRSCEDAGILCDLIAEHAIVNLNYKMDILNELDIEKRLNMLLEYLNEEFIILNTEHDIGEKVKASMDENQREYYLKERLKAINDELGENMFEDSDLAEELDKYTEEVDKLQLSEENEQKLKKEIEKLSKLPSISQEAGIIRSYLDACLALPWNASTVDETDIAKIRSKLDSDHYGMKEVKERIIEAIAVKQLCKEKNNQMILCLAGPPGVGKTSIAKSIAEALGKSYARVALGGVHDESEIRGHRRTYLGAMQGRIMHAMTQAKTNNPLILLDEIDKLGNDFRGDPTSALLEVLDSEQNFSFYDHYIDMPFDLSQVLFVTTANNLSAIPAPLRDRMDIIELSSYTSEEKLNIAKKHLIKKQLKKNGLTSKNFKITDSAL